MIVLSKKSADSSGSLIIFESPDSKIKDTRPRISRTPTLDGNCVIVHGGHSESDRQLEVKAEIGETDSDVIWALKDETILNISMPEGFFTGVISRIRVDNGKLSMSILIKEKLT